MNAQLKAETFKAELETKIRAVVTEFADGMLSREQFDILYERYSARLAIVNYALLNSMPEAAQIAQGGPPTIAVRDATMGKALGLMIYHNRSGTVIETLGDFNVLPQHIAAILTDFTLKMDAGCHLDHHVTKIDVREWLLFVPGRFSTVVTCFQNEPSGYQIRELTRLQHDFEEANRSRLLQEHIEHQRLAYPFMAFVQKKYGKKA